jgi:general secretion pathway protein F
VKYSIKALRPRGGVVSLTLEAADADSARRSVADQGLGVVSVRAANPLFDRIARPRTAFSVEIFGQELVSLLDAGLSLVEAIDLLADKEHSRSGAAVVATLRDALARGLSFADALQRQPAAFAPLFVASVRAAERSGDVREAVSRFLDYRAQVDRVRRKVIAASVYPLLLLAVGALVAGFMLVWVVPRFSRLYDELGSDLPWLTRMLMQWGDLLRTHAGAMLAGLVAVAGALVFAATRPALHSWLAPRLWRLPVLGERLRVYELARFYRTLAMLLDSGIVLSAALDMVAGLLSPLLRHALARAVADVREGQPVSRAFERHGLTTAVSLRLLAVGERSGRMPQMVARAAQFHEEEMARWIDWFTRLFEPVLMVLIGALVGLIVVLLYLPIFELADSVR